MEKRQIKQDVYEKVIKSIPEIVIEMLPDNPRELLKYARRVKNIRFSDGISEEVKILMQKYLLSDEEYLKTFYYVMAVTFYNKKCVKNPKMYVITAQTGSGKSNLTAKILREDDNCIFIDSDKYKHFRADAQEIANKYQVLYPFLTGPDSYDHADNIYQYAIDHKYNLIKEVAPILNKSLLGKEFKDIQKNKYKLSVHVLAVSKLNSSLSIHERYELQIMHNLKTAKLTDLKRHEDSYNALQKNIQEIEKDINVFVYTRGTKENNFEPIKVFPEREYKTASESIEEERKKDYIKTLEKFEDRFNLVLKQMKKRNAPQEQIEQLNNIYKIK